MGNTPLTSNEQNKIVIFVLLLLPAVCFGVGVLPALFLIFGFFMMSRSEDFGHIEVAVKNFKIYMAIISLAFTALMAYESYETLTYHSPFVNYPADRNVSLEIILGLAFVSAAYAYCTLINSLFLRPLVAHKEWVEINGVFASKHKSSKISNASQAEIIKGERFKTYSVADELIKWAQLKEGGHISEQQYEEAKNKLLSRG